MPQGIRAKEGVGTMKQVDAPQERRCGHNFEPDECPHKKCGYREALKALDMEEARLNWLAEVWAGAMVWEDRSEPVCAAFADGYDIRAAIDAAMEAAE